MRMFQLKIAKEILRYSFFLVTPGKRIHTGSFKLVWMTHVQSRISYITLSMLYYLSDLGIRAYWISESRSHVGSTTCPTNGVEMLPLPIR
jgi:hypothetical protein